MAYDPNTTRRSAGPNWVVWLAIAVVVILVAALIWWAVADDEEDAGVVDGDVDVVEEDGAVDEEVDEDGIVDDEGAHRVITGKAVAFNVDGMLVSIAA